MSGDARTIRPAGLIRWGAAAAATASLALLALTGPVAAGTAHPLTAWDRAEQVPGLTHPGTTTGSTISSMSCFSPGNCGAGGYEAASSGAASEAFVVSQTGGTWGNAEQVPGIATLNTQGNAATTSISCTSAGNCSAGGLYSAGTSGGTDVQAFVVSQASGTWGTAEAVPGTATLNKGLNAEVKSLSCGSAGNCSAGGFYTDSAGHRQAFVVNETNGTWGTAQEVPGTAALNAGGLAGVNSVSCASPGNCVAGGSYSSSATSHQVFVVAEQAGTWGTAQEVASTLNTGDVADINSVSCTSPGDCAAGGYYSTSPSPGQYAFAVAETNGTWGTPEEIAGNLNLGGNGMISTLSCASVGNCAAGGFYIGKSAGNKAFVVSEANGTWAKAVQVAGTLNTDLDAGVMSVSCGSAGDCSAGGYYNVRTRPSSNIPREMQQAFVVSETSGTWGNAEEVPGSAVLNATGFASVNAVSCASADHCSAGGAYSNHSLVAFVASQY